MKSSIVVSLVLFFASFSYGQTSALISKKKTDANVKLCANVYCSLKDRDGNLWFGTSADGVYCYNGEVFKNFTTKDGLSDNCIWALMPDKAGKIWISTIGGLCVYDGKIISKIKITDSIKSTGAIFQDRDGIIWIATEQGIYLYDGKTFKPFLENESIINKDGLTLNSVQQILQDKKGNMWFTGGMGSTEGVTLYDGKSIVGSSPNGNGWVPFMLEDKAGNIWFSGRSHGYFRYDGKTFTDFTENIGFSLLAKDTMGTFCLKGKVNNGPLLQDKAGNIWFTAQEKKLGGSGGVWRYDGKTCTHFTTDNGFTDAVIWCMVEDNAGNIWIGTNNTGLYCYDGKVFRCFSEEE
jgi:ligand-binding sensor domain-containing protein